MANAAAPRTSRRLDAWRAALARDPLFGITFAVLSLAALAPVWSLRGAAGGARVDAAGVIVRVLVALYAIALPAAAALFAERFGRSRWLAVLVFPLAWNVPLGRGDLLFAAALPAALLTIAAIDRALESPSRVRVAAALGLGLVTFVLHPVPFAIALAPAAAVVLGRAREAGARRTLARLAGLALVAGIAIVALRFAAPAAWQALAIAREEGPGAEPLIEALREIHRRIVITWPERGDDLALMALALSWLLVTGAAAERASGGGAAARAARSPLVPEAGFLVAAVACFLLPARPDSFGAFGDAHLQLLPIAGLFGAVLARGPVDGWRRALLLPAIAAALLYPVQLAARPFSVSLARPAAATATTEAAR